MSDDLERLERERLDADRRYNEALTAFDAALVHLPPIAGAIAAGDAALPPLPAGWRGRWMRTVEQWLRPWTDRQRTFNTQAADAVQSLTAHERERAAAFDRFQSALVVFAQHITAFVESKDRQLAAHAAHGFDTVQRRLEELQRKVDALSELQTRLAVLQRTTEMLARRLDRPAAGPPPHSTETPPRSTPSPPAPSSVDSISCKYVAFEDEFRGSDEAVSAKLREYVPIFTGATDVVDIGCGRGEFLAALQAAGVPARGIDTNGEMVAVARERGLDAIEADALGYVVSLPDASIGGAIATQVVEHLEPRYLMQLVDALSQKLRRGAPIVLETINPTCWYAFFSSYIRDFTHVRPVHPETLQYLLRASGFERVEIRYRSPLPDHVKMRKVDLPEQILKSTAAADVAIARVGHTVNTNAHLLNDLLFSYMDYAAIGYRC
jgi:SAM-dependent methyltransferase